MLEYYSIEGSAILFFFSTQYFCEKRILVFIIRTDTNIQVCILKNYIHSICVYITQQVLVLCGFFSRHFMIHCWKIQFNVSPKHGKKSGLKSWIHIGETFCQHFVFGFTMFELLKFVLPWYGHGET